MPLFFSSSALYPARVMPGWLQVISKINPLSYEVEALRGLLIGTSTDMPLDVVVLVAWTLASIITASLLLPPAGQPLNLFRRQGMLANRPGSVIPDAHGVPDYPLPGLDGGCLHRRGGRRVRRCLGGWP
jgi:hypothetical protein